LAHEACSFACNQCQSLVCVTALNAFAMLCRCRERISPLTPLYFNICMKKEF
jgi:hypothetical protein